jgi:hypothetical protein
MYKKPVAAFRVIVIILQVTLFMKLVPALRLLTVTLKKVFPKAAVILKIVLKACHKCTLLYIKPTNEKEGK